MKYKFAYLILIFSLFTSAAAAQGTKPKDLQKQAYSNSNDEEQVDAMLALYRKEYQSNSPEKLMAGFPLVFEAYELSLKLSYGKGIADGCLLIGDHLRFFKNQRKAIEYYFIGLTQAEKALEHRIAAKINIGIGLIYYEQKKWDDAMKYFKKADQSNALLKLDKSIYTPTYLLGLCYLEKEDYKKANNYFNTSLQIASGKNDSTNIQECRLGIARALTGLGQNDTALKIYRDLIPFYEHKNEYQALMTIYLARARHYENIGNLKQALSDALKAQAEDQKSSIHYLAAEVTDLLAKIYYKQGETEKAYLMMREHKAAIDSSTKRDILSQIAVTQAQHDFSKKEAEYNQQLQQDRRKRNYAISIVIVLSVFILFGLYFYSTLRKERRKSEKLLLNILPKETAEELKKYGRAIAKRHESTSIMFCDVKSFTLISESMQPEVLINMLDEYISAFDRIISQYGLEKIKTIGDAYMCVSGLNKHSKEHAKAAVKAALEMLQFVNDSKQQFDNKYGTHFMFRIGIHSAPVISGVVGSHKYAYDIWGDAVNTAARMEQTSIPGRINISQATFDLLNNEFAAEFRGEISSKNKKDMKMYFVEQKNQFDKVGE